jgi:hypothetical protein
MPLVMPGQSNTYVPVALAGDKLLVDVARDPKRFKIARYSQVVPVERDTGYYLYLSPDEAGRILYSDLRDLVWYDGADAPRRHDSNREFEFRPYRTQRYAYEFVLGWKAVEQASWDIIAKHAQAAAQRAMTARTQAAANILFDSTQYESSHVINVSTTYGGTWATSDLSSKRILKSLNDAADIILNDTLGAVTKDDLVLVMGTGVAKAIAQSTEVIELLRWQAGWDYLRGASERTNVSYGVPEALYGYPVVVDETRKVTSRKGGARTVESVLPSNMAVLLARPGGMEGSPGVINFSALVFFMNEEMTVETKEDADNRRTIGRVVEDFDCRLVAPSAAVLFTNVV